MDVRKEIRSIIKEVFSEAVPSSHFHDRVYERLTSVIYTKPEFDYSKVKKQIDTIKNINFEDNSSYAIFIKRFPKTFVSKDPLTGQPSIGDELWAVVRDNVITTIFFRNSSQKETKVKDVDNVISIKELYKLYTSSEKNEDGTVDYIPKEKRPGKGSRKKPKLDLPIVKLGGADWFIDEENEQLIYYKNIKKKIPFDELKDEYFEKVVYAATS